MRGAACAPNPAAGVWSSGMPAGRRPARRPERFAMRLDNRLVRLTDRVTRWIYAGSRGRIGHRQMGWTMLLLTTTGRRTGRPRTHTLVYLRDGDRLLIVASNNGADRNPAWYLNLVAHPRVFVRCG